MTRLDWSLARVLAALVIIALCCIAGCGAVSLEPLDASAGDVGPGNPGDLGTDDGRPDLTVPPAVPTGPETHPDSSSIPDAGAPLPVCPPEIMFYDCPQPKCDCRDR